MVNGSTCINDLIEQSDYSEVKTIERLASLRLAGLIDESEKSTDTSDHLAVMVNRVSGLLEDYLTHRTGRVNRTGQTSRTSKADKETVGEGNN